MSDIIVVVKPIFKILEDADFDWRSDPSLKKIVGENTSAKYCFSCGSPLMYVEEENKRTEDRTPYVKDVNFYCAVCGEYQGGFSLPNPFEENQSSASSVRNEE